LSSIDMSPSLAEASPAVGLPRENWLSGALTGVAISLPLTRVCLAGFLVPRATTRTYIAIDSNPDCTSSSVTVNGT
jgi:hypothetical protein